MSTFLEACKTELSELESAGRLEAYAAGAAVSELLHNWEAAVKDGARPANLLADVEHVIAELRVFRDAVVLRMNNI